MDPDEEPAAACDAGSTANLDAASDAASAQRQNLVAATAVARGGRCLLLQGPPGVGKSDLALRLITAPPAGLDPNSFVLVADDWVRISRDGDRLLAGPPETIAGRLEVRGIGIVDVPFATSAEVALVVALVQDRGLVERMPEPETTALFGLELPLIRLCAFDASAPAKLSLALSLAGTGRLAR